VHVGAAIVGGAALMGSLFYLLTVSSVKTR